MMEPSGSHFILSSRWRESLYHRPVDYYIIRPAPGPVNNTKLEKLGKIPGEKLPRRKLLRHTYESSGPNDERYYVSNSSGFGTDASKAETDSSGKEDESNIFVRLLQNQVRNYQSKPRDKKKESKLKKKSRAPPPPSPTPDYLQEEPNPLKPKEKPNLLSKSFSSLVREGKPEDQVRLEKKISGSSLELRGSQTTPVPDYEVDPVRGEGELSDRDVWGNVERYRGVQAQAQVQGSKRGADHQINSTQKRNKDFLAPTETLKEVIKHRPPVAQVVREITEESERDKIRQKRRENMMRQTESKASQEEDEAQKVYREIMEVVGSTPCGRGRMVGYGEEAQTTLRRGDRSNAARLGPRQQNRYGLSDDRASVTTSIDNYPFSPSSPWAHALPSRYNRYGYPVFPQKTFGLPSPSGPVSFAGFSSPPSQLTSSSFRAAPASLTPGQGREKLKRTKKWFNIF